MLKIEKVFCPDGSLEITLIGSVDELSPLDTGVGEVPDLIRVNCREVSRLNSIGIKIWINYFQELKKKGKQVIFQECSVPVVFALGMLSNFTAGYPVSSLFAEYSCEKCTNTFDVLFTVEKLVEIALQLPEMPCKTCSGPAHCSEGPEYLAFLKDTQRTQLLGSSG
ncbi:MAG: hypothetical protein AABZ55_14245 [Bdellovibrionota bacterium]